jgi:addiction module HigA family antidote
MSSIRYRYDPDHVAPPGALVAEYLQAHEMSARELARRCGRSAKLIVEILGGKAPLEPETALQFERVLGLDATIWLNLEAAYRLHLARQQDDRQLAKHHVWIKDFPLGELQSRGFLTKSDDEADRVRQFIQFFGVGSVHACRERFSEMAEVAYRHSPSFKSSKEALLVWLRIGEIEAQNIETKDYDKNAFVEVLRDIRTLTVKPIEEFAPKISRLCANAGVAFVIVRPIRQLALSGISRWLTPRKALIQQTLRHLTNDHFWFTFFHEAAHLLLHSRKSVFLDNEDSGNADPDDEREANEWAANFLIPDAIMNRWISRSSLKEEDVRKFAQEQQIHPGIVVGQLQHRGLIGYHQLNKLRDRFAWPK